MQADRWRKIDDIFQSILDCTPDKRTALLESSCGGDAELQNEIESLLAAYEKVNFTRSSAFQDGMKLLDQQVSKEGAGRRIGPYRVVQEIGYGGMGSVYLASRADDAYKRFVAIKLIRRGLDTDIVRRFHTERQILASLDHPNIARLLDAGSTEDGLPYFVMEYIEGQPIDQYCDEHNLNITERLKLFQDVCMAVRYAHQNLVIHRDIKPGNVLITKDGVPRLLDFGIAKLMAPGTESDQTLTRIHPLTPQYASPEQVRGQVVTTASDVYSLGVLLYVLLTGQRPYRGAMSSAAEIERTICEEEPEKPSIAVLNKKAIRRPDNEITRISISQTSESTPEKLRRRLQGDLDNIVLKALNKEPQRRYASVEQFSEDIKHHLENLPVIARRDTPGYLATKFVARHRTGVTAAGLVVLVLVAGIIGTSWQARVARAERARAEQQFNDVRKLVTSFLFEFNNSIQNLPGATPARKLLVQRALEYLTKLAQQSQRDPGLQRELAEAYLKIGDLQGNPYEPNLGDVAGAQSSYQKALAISAGLASADSKDAAARRYLARSYQSLGEVLPLLGKAKEGAEDIRKATETFQGLLDASSHDRDLRIQTANCYESLGDLLGHGELQNLGDRTAAVANYRKSLAIFDAMAADDSNDLKARSGTAVLRIRIGDMLLALGDLNAALENYRAALPRAESIAAADPKNERFLRVLALSHRKMGDAETQENDLKQALEDTQRASTITERLANADPDNAQALANLASSLTAVAGLLNKTGKRADALQKYRRAIAIIEKLSTASPSDLFTRGQLGEVLVFMGSTLDSIGKRDEASSATARGLAIERELASRDNATTDELSRYASALLMCEPSSWRQPITALQFAKKAEERSQEKDVKSLDILALAYFRNGDSKHAIETEEKVLNLIPQIASPARKHAEAQLTIFRNGPQNH